ncbi:MAG TPA: CDP-glucose 4,6-dehydratase [Puia sp.]|nr:CDP-glucose 4,6-dehydratase [Puia sp.]
MNSLFNNTYSNKKVLLTGHTGFKGSWLLLWLKELGATVKGLSLEPATQPAHISLLDLFDENSVADIRNYDIVSKAVSDFQPDIIFHLAAQPIVKRSYRDPLETFNTNLMGTVNVLEAARNSRSVKAIVNITTDKVYQNHEWHWPYRETDRLGGHDPYSTSKACVELLHESYKKSYFKELGILSATARAGNVIGGGDWSENRLIPDIVKATVKSEQTEIRNPQSVRPWQHVLDPLSGYLMLGQHLLEGNALAEGAWNFGPDIKDCLSVAQVLNEFSHYWPGILWKDVSMNKKDHESNMLRLDCSKAFYELGWTPVWPIEIAVQKTASWYKNFYQNNSLNSFNNLKEYISDAIAKKATWAS